jgi:hypothetical protein
VNYHNIPQPKGAPALDSAVSAPSRKPPRHVASGKPPQQVAAADASDTPSQQATDSGKPPQQVAESDASGTPPRQAAFSGKPPQEAVASDVKAGRRVDLPGEDAAAFDLLVARVTDAVGPRDIIEEIWVRDFVELVLEGAWLRRQKKVFLVSSNYVGVRDVLAPTLGYKTAQGLAEGWRFGKPEAVAAVSKTFEGAGLTLEAATAQTLTANLKFVERLDALIAKCEMRRMMLTREIDRHRGALASALRREAVEIDKSEYSEVTSESGPGDTS